MRHKEPHLHAAEALADILVFTLNLKRFCTYPQEYKIRPDKSGHVDASLNAACSCINRSVFLLVVLKQHTASALSFACRMCTMQTEQKIAVRLQSLCRTSCKRLKAIQFKSKVLHLFR